MFPMLQAQAIEEHLDLLPRNEWETKNEKQIRSKICQWSPYKTLKNKTAKTRRPWTASCIIIINSDCLDMMLIVNLLYSLMSVENLNKCIVVF